MTPSYRKQLSLLLFTAISSPLFAASTGSSALIAIQGSGSTRANGDYVAADSGGLDSAYRYFIEVPPGQSQLVVQIFDADTGGGGSGEASPGRDRARSSFNTSTRYRLIDPSGTTIGDATISTTGSLDNIWGSFPSIENPEAGHWLFLADTSSAVTGGDDINAFGLRAHDGDETAGGTEFNIYAESFSSYGSQTGTFSERTYTEYPYVTSGCNLRINDFDFDGDGTVEIESRTGLYSASDTNLSGNNVWSSFLLSGWSDFGVSEQAPGGASWEVGIWKMTTVIDIGNVTGNYGQIYLGAFNVPAPNPVSQPVTDAFRIYLPTDAGTAPVKPYATQRIFDVIAGANPPVAGSVTDLRMAVSFTNPTSFPVTFSATNTARVNIPGTTSDVSVTYLGSPGVSQGSIVSQPEIGAGGPTANIVWNPGVVAAGSTIEMTYRVRVNATSGTNGSIIPVTGTTGSGDGTQWTYVDETGNTTQSQATMTFGPLCELSVTLNGNVLSVDLGDVQVLARDTGDGVDVVWETLAEVNSAAFVVHRGNMLRGGMNALSNFISAQGDINEGSTYLFTDPEPLASGEIRSYYIEELTTGGGSNLYGPFAIESMTTVGSHWQHY